MAPERPESRYPDDLALPFIFVAHGEPEPPELAEFKARYPGWFTIPADFIPYAHPPMAEPEPAGVNRFETTLPDSRPVPPSPQRDGRTDWDGAVRGVRASDAAFNNPAALLRGSPVTRDWFGRRGDSDAAPPRDHANQLAQAFVLPGLVPPPPGEAPTDDLDESARALAEAITRGVRRVFKNEAKEEPRSPGDILVPSGVPIGTPNKGDERVRNLPGGAKAAEELFEKLSKGGTPTKSRYGKGVGVDLPGGGFVGYRPKSNSGGPAIDVNIPGVGNTKLHFP